MFKKVMKYIIIALFSIVISKWIILDFIPNNNTLDEKQNATVEKSLIKKISKKVHNIELDVDYSEIMDEIENEYNLAKEDINSFIQNEIENQKNDSKYRLSQDDGFLDWLFGWGTGYKMMWKKAKGLAGSKDNEIKMVSDKFQEDVINPRFNTTITNIQEYSKNRIDEYYKNVILITTNYINNKIKKLHTQGFSNITIKENTMPWGRYVTIGLSDGFAVAEITGLTSVSIVAGKFVGAKVATILGPKMFALLSAKTASVVAGKIASMFSLILAPIIDYAMNEGTRLYKYNDTKKDFENMIDTIFNETQSDIRYDIYHSLDLTRDSIYTELNKQTKIIGERK